MDNKNVSLNRKSDNFKEMKRTCKLYLSEGKEESPELAGAAMEIAQACINWMVEIGEIKV